MPLSYPTAKWSTLVRGCALLSAAIAIGRGIAVFDRESIAIGALLAVFTWVTFTRRGAIGWIGVAALLVNQAFWMVTATANLTHAAPSFVGAAIPSVLSTAALLGLVASVARWRAQTDTGAGVAASVAAGLAVLLLIAVPIAGRNAVVVHPGDLRISARNVKFSTTRLTARAGDIGVVFTNDDLFWHTFTVGKLDVNLRVATSGRGRVVLKDVPAGTYSFVCAIPGHESAGMKGELVVGSGGVEPNETATAVKDLTWISENHGWALTDPPSVLTTTDGGDTWKRVDRGAPLENVKHIRFANATAGYAFDPAFMTTTDGGVTWNPQAGRNVAALEPAAGGDVVRLSYADTGCPGPCDWKVERAPVGSNAWAAVPIPSLQSQAGRARLVRDHADVYLAFMGNPAGGAEAQSDVLVSHDGGVTWSSLGEPCWPKRSGDETDTVAIAVGPGVFAALCQTRGNEPNSSVVITTTGGRTFSPRRAVPVPFAGEIAITSARDLFVASGATGGAGPYTYELAASHDGGQSWQVAVKDDGQAGFDQAYLGFQSGQVGRWVGYPTTIWTTTDGGAHWKAHRLT